MIAEAETIFNKSINEKVMDNFGFDFYDIWENKPELTISDKLHLRNTMILAYDLFKDWDMHIFNHIKILFYKISKHYNLTM